MQFLEKWSTFNLQYTIATNSDEGTILVIKESKENRKITEKEFIQTYDMPEDLFDMMDYTPLAPRFEQFQNKHLGKTNVLVLSFLNNSNEGTVDKRLEALTAIYTEDMIFLFLFEHSELFDDIHQKDIKNIEEIILYLTIESGQHFIYDLKKENKSIETLNDKFFSGSDDSKLLKKLTNTERNLVLLDRTINSQCETIEKMIDQSHFTDDELLYDVRWINDMAKELVDVTRDLLDTLSSNYRSLMSQRLNKTMRFLNSFSLVLSAATMIFSLWGINTGVPWEADIIGFWIVILIGSVIAFVTALYLRKKDLT